MKKKLLLGLMCGIFILGIATGCGNEQTEGSSSNNNTQSNADLTIDKTISKTMDCQIKEKFLDKEYSYDIVKLNLNRYTFLKEYSSGVDFDDECRNKGTDSTKIYTDDFELSVNYTVRLAYLQNAPTIKEQAMGGIYASVGKPELRGNDNGYWFTQMTDNEQLNVYIYREANIMEYRDGDTIMSEGTIKKARHALEFTIRCSYKNDKGKDRLNYLLNEIKDMFKDKYNMDLSDLSIDMIEK